MHAWPGAGCAGASHARVHAARGAPAQTTNAMGGASCASKPLLAVRVCCLQIPALRAGRRSQAIAARAPGAGGLERAALNGRHHPPAAHGLVGHQLHGCRGRRRCGDLAVAARALAASAAGVAGVLQDKGGEREEWARERGVSRTAQRGNGHAGTRSAWRPSQSRCGK